ncbi:MAG: SgcJ/EcaC family oxidoreductase [Verrucomicrobia bacterium]|nr:SgcJ/EcaC family oxidoreductase [Verrucomicrobiota bacterium]
MKKCLLVPLIGLAISFALPTYAQQKDLADPQTTQKILALAKAFDEAHSDNDATAVATLFTRDAVLVTTDDSGPIIGRQAIQKYYTDLYQWWHPKNCVTKLDENAAHLIGTAGNELWATGEWNETGQGKTGEPLPIKGHWACIYVREGGDWRIRVAAWYTNPESFILINKTFAPQSAATPSPSFALPTYAQQKDLADPQTTQKLFAIGKAAEEAHNNHDAAAAAAIFSRDAVFWTPEGFIIGRQAIQKWYTDLWRSWHPKNHIVKLDGNAFHWIGTAGNALWATGELSGIGQGETRDGKLWPEKPIPASNYWLNIYVREGDDWKVRVSAWGETAASVILANKTWAPVVTPSPTAKP